MGYRLQGRHRVTTMADIERLRADLQPLQPCLWRVEPETVTELPLMQQLALLTMMNSTLARGLGRRMASVDGCQDRPAFHDFRALVAHSLAYRGEEDRWHTLTPDGWAYARAMVKRLCLKYDVHIMSEDRYGGGTVYRCSCGQWSTQLYGAGGTHQWRRAMNRFYAHLPAEAKRAESA